MATHKVHNCTLQCLLQMVGQRQRVESRETKDDGSLWRCSATGEELREVARAAVRGTRSAAHGGGLQSARDHRQEAMITKNMMYGRGWMGLSAKPSDRSQRVTASEVQHTENTFEY